MGRIMLDANLAHESTFTRRFLSLADAKFCSFNSFNFCVFHPATLCVTWFILYAPHRHSETDCVNVLSSHCTNTTANIGDNM